MKITKSSEVTTVKPAAISRGLFRRQSTKSSLTGGTTSNSNEELLVPPNATATTPTTSNNTVNGLPDFENPLEAAPTSGKVLLSDVISPIASLPPTSRERMPPRKPQRLLSKRLEDRKTILEKSSQPAGVPAPLPPTQKASEYIVQRQKVSTFPDNDYYEYYENEGHMKFENMIIECDDDFSTDELTNDGSFMHDEGYWRDQQQQQQQQQQQNYRGRQDSYSQQPCMVSPQWSQRQPNGGCVLNLDADAAAASPSRNHSKSNNNSYSSDHHRSTSNNDMRPSLSQQLSMEEEEQLLIDIAMARSLQDSQSVASMSSVSGRGSYRSRASSGCVMSTSSNLGSAGCHLAMMASSGTGGGHHHGRSSSDGQSSGANNNFIWKREGKKWLKIPIHGNHHHHPGVSSGAGDLCLQAIEEVENEMNDSLHQSLHKSKYIEREGEKEESDCFDLHHQNNVDDAMHRSLTAQLNRSSDNWSSAEGSFADEDEELNRKAILARRLEELEQERALIERAMQEEPSQERYPEPVPPRLQMTLDRQAPTRPSRQISLDRQAPVPPIRQQSLNPVSETRPRRRQALDLDSEPPQRRQSLDQPQSFDRDVSPSDRRSSFQARPRPVSSHSSDVSLCSGGSLDRRSLSSNSLVSGSGGGGGGGSLSGAGCHLAMIASAARHGGRDGSRSSTDSSANKQKLVWKKGPNSAWGRFPENDDHCEEQEVVDISIQNREEAMVAEALKRSLNEM